MNLKLITATVARCEDLKQIYLSTLSLVRSFILNITNVTVLIFSFISTLRIINEFLITAAILICEKLLLNST